MVKCSKRLYVWTENIKVVGLLCVSQFNKYVSGFKGNNGNSRTPVHFIKQSYNDYKTA